MKSVYLAGHVNAEVPETLAWRVEAERSLRGNFDVISPVRDESKCTLREIFMACHMHVMRADLLLVMLNDFGSPRPMRGTFFEMAWAWERHLPIIAVTEVGEKTEDMLFDPFLLSTVTVWKSSLSSATSHLIECWA